MAPFGWAVSLQKCKIIATLSYYGFRLYKRVAGER